jgi:hypothetical protein
VSRIILFLRRVDKESDFVELVFVVFSLCFYCAAVYSANKRSGP